MFSLKYRILITSKCFPRDKVVCLGTQLIWVINSINDFLPQHVWYRADVKAVEKGARKYNVSDIQLNIICADSEFIELGMMTCSPKTNPSYRNSIQKSQ